MRSGARWEVVSGDHFAHLSRGTCYDNAGEELNFNCGWALLWYPTSIARLLLGIFCVFHVGSMQNYRAHGSTTRGLNVPSPRVGVIGDMKRELNGA